MTALRALLFVAAIVPAGMAHAQDAGRCTAPARAEPFIPALADSAKTYRGALSADGREFFFFRKVGGDPMAEDYRIYRSVRGPEGWSEARRVELGGEFSDLYPAISAAGRRLVFASYRRAPGDTAAKTYASLWYAERRGDAWGPAVFIAPASRVGHYHSQVSIDAAGAIYFRRTTPDGSSTTEYSARASGTGYAPAEPVPGADRWRTWRPGYHVWGSRPGHDGSYLLMEVSALDSTGRPGPSDLWVSTRGDGGWAEPVRLGAGVNTPDLTENFGLVTRDGCSLVFTRGFSSFHHVSLAAALADR